VTSTAGSERLRLDLGSGPRPHDGFRGVDKVPGLTDFCVDFDSGEPWPFEDGSVDELRSSHCIEHLSTVDAPVWEIWNPSPIVRESLFFDGPRSFRLSEEYRMRGGHLWKRTLRRKDTVLHFFDEAFRVIRPGGKFEVRWPSHQNSMSYGDPTHRRFLSGALILYLNRQSRVLRGVEWYDVTCNWTGGASETTSRSFIDSDVFRERLLHDWNVAEETVLNLIADK